MTAGALLGACALSGCLSRPALPGPARRRSIRPGEIWLDTTGKPIQAHAGAIIAVGRDFYWYGENKEFTDGKQGIESWGIRFYRSRDLYNWEDLGPIIPPDTADPTSPLSPKGFPERPHILFNPRTRKFVCWIKVRSGREPQYRTVLTADAITGPYTMVQRRLLPMGMAAGDFDLVVDPRDGKAYMYFEHDHEELICVELTPDWENVTDKFTRHFKGSRPPATPEGIACFQRNGEVFLTSSQMTGYFPNPSSVAVADGFQGPFTAIGDLHPSDASRTSFNSQISFIFKHPDKRDLYIALADRWMPDVAGRPDFASGVLSELVRSGIAKATAKPRQTMSPAERTAVGISAQLTSVNTSISRYVWLPIEFRDGRPTIAWRDEWTINEYT